MLKAGFAICVTAISAKSAEDGAVKVSREICGLIPVTLYNAVAACAIIPSISCKKAGTGRAAGALDAAAEATGMADELGRPPGAGGGCGGGGGPPPGAGGGGGGGGPPPGGPGGGAAGPPAPLPMPVDGG